MFLARLLWKGDHVEELNDGLSDISGGVDWQRENKQRQSGHCTQAHRFIYTNIVSQLHINSLFLCACVTSLWSDHQLQKCKSIKKDNLHVMLFCFPTPNVQKVCQDALQKMWVKQWTRHIWVFRITSSLPPLAASLQANSLQHTGEMCRSGNVLQVKMELALLLSIKFIM